MKTKTKKANATVMAVIIVIVAITAGLIGWLLARQSQMPATVPQQAVAPQPAQTQNAVQTQPTQPTQTVASQDSNAGMASWKTYVDDKNGFSFNYPSEWNIVNTSINKTLVAGDRLAAFGPTATKASSECRLEFVGFLTGNQTLQEFVENDISNLGDSPISEKYTSVNGYNTATIVLPSTGPGQDEFVYIEKPTERKVYELSIEYTQEPQDQKTLNNFNSLISTFKFN